MSESDVRVVIAGGGTGGHLYPGIALAEEISRRWPAQIMFIGTKYGIESKVLRGYPYIFKTTFITGLQRRLSLSNLLFPFRLLGSIIHCAIVLRKFRPRVVIGTGGYVSGPALMSALLLRIPTVLQEQNSYPGLVNRVVGNKVSQVHLTYENSRGYFAKNTNVWISGNPVRGNFGKVRKEDAIRQLALQPDRKTLLVFGGSQGARAINGVVAESLAALLENDILQMIWGTGASDYEHAKKAAKPYPQKVKVMAFINDMAVAYAASDLALCRSGASTLSEITLCGLPSILVPYPFAAEGHQLSNAQTIEANGAGIVIRESDLTGERLRTVITELLSDSQRMETMSKNARKLAKPEAAIKIVDRIEELVNE